MSAVFLSFRFSTLAWRAVLAVVLAVTLGACGSPFAEAPPVADTTLVGALAELHLAQARLSMQSDSTAPRRDGAAPAENAASKDSMRVHVPQALRDSILARYDLTSPQLRAAVEYYVRHPEDYTQLYRRVVDTLSAEYKVLRFGGGERRADTLRATRPVPEAFRRGR